MKANFFTKLLLLVSTNAATFSSFLSIALAQPGSLSDVSHPGDRAALINSWIAQAPALPGSRPESPRNPDDLILPRPSQELPPLPTQPPAQPPEPNLQIPAAPPPETPAGLPSSPFRVDKVEVTGNTILQTEIDQLVQPYENREVSFEELIELRSQITQLYIDSGYLTSGAFLPSNQDLTDRIVQIQIVEGRLERIDIADMPRLGQAYVRSRLEQANNVPLQQQELERALQLLQIDPLLEQVNAELTAGSAPGLSVLQVSLREAPPLQAGISVDNNQSPSIGSNQVTLFANYTNILGLGDRLSGQVSLTQGLDLYDLGYTIPVNGLDGAVNLRYSNNDSVIVEDQFQALDISSASETFSAGFRQPLFRSPTSEFALSVGIDLRRSQTFILGDEPFSFSEGAENGRSRVTVLRFAQDWVNRNATRVLAARSEFRFGLDLFDATVNDSGTDGRFVSWLGQFQWVQRFPNRLLLVSRINTQLTPDSLLSLERFSIGGVDTVRGYAQNQVVADNGVSGTVELRIPLTDDPNRLQLVPFLDAGYAWNNRTADPKDNAIAGLGLGVRWLITPDLDLRLDYGIPLIDVANQGNSLQESGVYFSLRYQPF